MRRKSTVLLLLLVISLLWTSYSYALGFKIGDWHWKSPVEAVGDLPTVGNYDGDVRVVTDDDVLYYYTGAAWVLASSLTNFVDLADTPAAYTTDGAIYVADNSSSDVDESTVILAEAANTFSITKGSASLDIAIGATLNIDTGLQVKTNAGILDYTGAGKTLTVELDSLVNQDLTSDASPTFAGLTVTNAITEFSTDGTLGDDADSALPTEKAVKTYVDTEVVKYDTFLELGDTPGAYTNAGALYSVNAVPDAVSETTVILAEAANTFNITKGTASLDIAAGATLNIDVGLQVKTNAGILDYTAPSKTLTVENSATVDQDYTTDADVSFSNFEAAECITFDAEYDEGNATGTETITWTDGNNQKSTLTGDCTYTFVSPPGVGRLILKGVNFGAFNPTWPGTVLWPAGTEPTWTVAGTDIITFYYDGSNYYGVADLNFS